MKLPFVFKISIVVNIVLLIALFAFLFTTKFDSYLFNKTIPYICSQAGKGGTVRDGDNVIKVGDLCLVNESSQQREEVPVDRKAGAKEESEY